MQRAAASFNDHHCASPRIRSAPFKATASDWLNPGWAGTVHHWLIHHSHLLHPPRCAFPICPTTYKSASALRSLQDQTGHCPRQVCQMAKEKNSEWTEHKRLHSEALFPLSHPQSLSSSLPNTKYLQCCAPYSFPHWVEKWPFLLPPEPSSNFSCPAIDVFYACSK